MMPSVNFLESVKWNSEGYKLMYFAMSVSQLLSVLWKRNVRYTFLLRGEKVPISKVKFLSTKNWHGKTESYPAARILRERKESQGRSEKIDWFNTKRNF